MFVIQLLLEHLKGVDIGITPLFDWLNVLPRGRGTAGVTELPLPPKGTLWHVVLTLKAVHATFVEHSRAALAYYYRLSHAVATASRQSKVTIKK